MQEHEVLFSQQMCRMVEEAPRKNDMDFSVTLNL